MAYSNIDKPNQYFNTILWTGDGTASQPQTGVGFQPDWVWIKTRSTTGGHNIFDVIRGATKILGSDTTNAESTNTDSLTSFDSDGFTLAGSGGTSFSGRTYVGWSWLADNTSGSSNTDGSITSTVSANTTSGFSIVSFTGNGSNDATIGHGLGTTPAMIITKNRDDSVNWRVWHKDLTSNYVLFLASTLAEIAPAGQSNGYIKTVGSSTYSVYQGNVDTNGVNGSGDAMIAYCFAEKKGFSKFGSYTGNGSTDGTFVYTGFKPAFVIMKRTNTTGEWGMFDNKRDSFNVATAELKANASDAEEVNGAIDFLSNGFKLRATSAFMNASGSTYIYMCFAENPLVGSNLVPTNAR